MGLYPELNDESQKPQCLEFSQASKVAGFETVNDKVLMEMNARARRILHTPAAETGTLKNPFDMPPPTKALENASPRAVRAAKRFSAVHHKEFAKMESITSCTFKRPGNAAPARPMSSNRPASQTELSLTSPSKRSGKLLESPSKRLKPSTAPTDGRRAVQAVRKQTTKGSVVPSMATLTTPSPGPRHAALKPAARSGTVPRGSTASRLPRSGTTSNIGQLGSQQTLAAASGVLGDFSNLPSYARPTQSALRKSQSLRTLPPTDINNRATPTAKPGGPAKVASMLANLPNAPRRIAQPFSRRYTRK